MWPPGGWARGLPCHRSVCPNACYVLPPRHPPHLFSGDEHLSLAPSLLRSAISDKEGLNTMCHLFAFFDLGGPLVQGHSRRKKTGVHYQL